MEFLAIIQARCSSSRLPGKVLKPVEGIPLIEYQINRIRRSRRLSQLIVATSDETSDDPLREYLCQNGIPVFAGSLERVASRFDAIVEAYKPTAICRICADSPCYDPELLDVGIELFQGSNVDVVTNVHPRSFPKGYGVEIIRADFFRRWYPKLAESDDNEVFMNFFYRNSKDIKILNFNSGGKDRSTSSHCVDTLDDFVKFSKLIERVGNAFQDLGWQQIDEFYQSLVQ